MSDLITRLGYHDQGYTALFAADYHIGKPPSQAVDEYRKRSPIWNAHRLKLPLMVTSTTNDRDVSVVEVEQLVNDVRPRDNRRCGLPRYGERLLDDRNGRLDDGKRLLYNRNA